MESTSNAEAKYGKTIRPAARSASTRIGRIRWLSLPGAHLLTSLEAVTQSPGNIITCQGRIAGICLCGRTNGHLSPFLPSVA
jgi:hypothetical protein